MATRTVQRIGIWTIAIVLTVGTLAGFVAIILAPQNQATDQARIKELTSRYQADTKEYQAKVDAQAADLSTQYYPIFKEYATRPTAFDKEGVASLSTSDLKIGDGAELTKDSSFTAYYIGWNPSGVVFDGSIEGGTLKAPFSVTPGGVITGWTEGVAGMKIGGVRELSIPADKAYGAAGSGDKIPPNTPIKFVIMVIATPTTIPQPEIPAELLKYYSQNT